MLSENGLKYFDNQKFENVKFWKRLGGKPNLENKTVLEFTKIKKNIFISKNLFVVKYK